MYTHTNTHIFFIHIWIKLILKVHERETEKIRCHIKLKSDATRVARSSVKRSSPILMSHYSEHKEHQCPYQTEYYRRAQNQAFIIHLIQTANSEASVIAFIQSKRVQCPDIHRILRHLLSYTHLYVH